MAFGQRIFDPRDVRELHLAATVCDTDRRILEQYEQDRPEFREFDRFMRSNNTAAGL